MPSEEAPPDAGLEAADSAASVRKALMDLEAESRAVIVLRDIEGQSYEEIALSLGIPEGRSSRASLARAWRSRQIEAVSLMEHVSKLLSAFMDGKLAQAEREMVESHLERCEACSAELKDLKSLSACWRPRRRSRCRWALCSGSRTGARPKPRPTKPSAPTSSRRAGSSPPRGCPPAVVFIFAYDVLRGPGRVEERVRDLAPLSKLTELGPNRLEGRAGAAGALTPTDKVFGMAAAPAAAPQLGPPRPLRRPPFPARNSTPRAPR